MMSKGFKAFDAETGRSFAKSTKSKFFKYSNAGKAYSRTFRDKSVEVFPGIGSFDDKFLSFTSELAKTLFNELSSEVLPNGFFDSKAVSTNFQELNTVAGVKMKPIGYAMIGNDALRNEKGLVGGFVKPRHERIFSEMMSLKYDGFDDDAIGKIARISSSGFPLFTSDLAYKHQHFGLIANNIGQILDNVVKGDHLTNFEKFGLTAASTLSIRSQYDSFQLVDGKFRPKPRLVNDIDYALSGGLRGARYEADKSVKIEGFLYPGKSATRSREVNAKPSAYNNVGTAVLEGLRSYGEKKYSATWKHRGREDIQAKIDKYSYVLGLDVTQYDQSFPEWLFEEWLKRLPITEKFRAYARMGMNAPSFYSSNGEISDPIWTGDPMDQSYFTQYKGLPSGIFFTSMLGKDGFTFAVLCMLDDLTSDVAGNIDTILKHEHPLYAISNMGDDTIIHSNSESLLDRLKNKASSQEFGMSEYFSVDIEEGLKFLGNVGYIDAKAGLPVLAGDIGTYLGNMLVPERSIGSKMREFGVYGLLERRNVYMDNPSFGKVDEIFQKLFRDTFHVNWFDLMDSNLVLPESIDVHVESAADLAVLLDPSKLFYLYDAENINPSIVETIESNMDRKNVEMILKECLDI